MRDSKKKSHPHLPAIDSSQSALLIPCPRRRTRKICVGSVAVGGDSPISVQSMTKTDTRDVEATLREVNALEIAGCEIVRPACTSIFPSVGE